MRKVSSGYKRERYLSDLFGVAHVAFSGSKFEYGHEDGEDGQRLLQYKSTATDIVTVRFRDLFSLQMHAQSKMPTFVLDFMAPSHGVIDLPESIWVAVPFEQYQEMYAALKREKNL